MRQLLSFLIRRTPFLLCLLYVGISLFLLTRSNPYHRNILLGSANRIVGSFYTVTGNISGYFNLQEINRELHEQNEALEMELLRTRSLLEHYQSAEALQREIQEHPFPYRFVSARVINNSTNRIANYITLDKGRSDGIAPDMGVVDHNGIVGIVSAVSDRFAVVISLLNPKLQLSCKVKGSDYFGSLIWDGEDPAYAHLEELPRHVELQPGDTVVTSGYSAVFPEGLVVGRIESVEKQQRNNSNTFRVALSTDFGKLKEVRVLANQDQAERRSVEKEGGDIHE